MSDLTEVKTNGTLEENVQELANLCQGLILKQIKQDQQLNKIASMFQEFLSAVNKSTSYNPVEETK